MNIDSFYTNGKMHNHKGEDYALHGDDFFIICDGCSSSENSDLVARLQAHIAKSFIPLLKKGMREIKAIEEIADELKFLSNELEIKGMPLATLMIGFVSETEVTVIVAGDGAIFFKDKGQNSQIINIIYESNAPYYPYYYTSEDLKKEYYKNYPNDIKNVEHSESTDKQEKGINFTDRYYVNKLCLFYFTREDLEYLYLFSDGISEFLSPKGKIPIGKAVSSFTNMKNTNGSFIQRRCARQLKNFEKDRVLPMDDFSMAGIYLNK